MNIFIDVDKTHIRRRQMTSRFLDHHSNIGKPVVLEKLIPVSFFNRFSLTSLAMMIRIIIVCVNIVLS